MENKSHAVIAVVFLVVFSVGAAVVYMWMHRGPREDRYYDIVSRYAVGGLQPEAAVNFKGLRVGNVKRLFFDPNDPEKVIVRIGVFPDAYITHATYAQLGYQGITGMTYITLANTPSLPGTPLKTSLRHPARIPMHQGLLQSVEQAGTADLDKVGRVIDQVNQLLNEKNRRTLADTLTHVDQASRRLVALERQLAPALKTMPAITAEMSRLLEQTRELEATVNRTVQRAQRSVTRVGGAARSIKRLSDSGDRLVNRLDETTLPRIDALTRRISQSISRINQLSQQLQAQPQSLIFGPSPGVPGPGEPGFHPPSEKE